VSFYDCKDHILVLVVVLLCSLVDRYQPFKGRCCFHLKIRLNKFGMVFGCIVIGERDQFFMRNNFISK